MTNNPIEYLIAEHDVISRVEELIPDIERCRHTNIEVYEETIQKLISFFREYADKFHHFKEEEVLFPKMNAHHHFSQQELIDELEDHHELFRERLSAIETSIHEKNYEQAQYNLETYLDELLSHIGAENDELFVMAETLFTDNELESMYFSFKDIDMKFGEDKKQNLVESLDEIEKNIPD